MDEPKLDWSSAEVRDGNLKVRLEGELPDGWLERFERTVALLNHDHWEKVKLKKSEVRVGGLTSGDEDRLRHFLESAVQEANTLLEPPAEEEGSEAPVDEDDEDDEHETIDQEMTDRFRSFPPR